MFGGLIVAIVFILGFLFWDRFAVVTRSATQQVRSAEAVLAAKACGASKLRILVSEILPNILNPLSSWRRWKWPSRFWSKQHYRFLVSALNRRRHRKA